MQAQRSGSSGSNELTSCRSACFLLLPSVLFSALPQRPGWVLCRTKCAPRGGSQCCIPLQVTLHSSWELSTACPNTHPAGWSLLGQSSLWRELPRLGASHDTSQGSTHTSPHIPRSPCGSHQHIPIHWTLLKPFPLTPFPSRSPLPSTQPRTDREQKEPNASILPP